MSLVWDMDLPSSRKMVLLALADCANDEGLAWPSIATIARKCSVDRRTAQRSLRQLELDGYLARQEVIGKGCKYQIGRRQCATGGRESPAADDSKRGGTAPPKLSGTVNNKRKNAHEKPDGWEPKEFGKDTESREIVDSWTAKELRGQIERFEAHHLKLGSKFKDWQAAWSTWVLNSIKFGGSKNGKQSTSDRDPIFAAGERLDKLYGQGGSLSAN